VAGAEVTVFEDGGVRIVKIGPMGPYGNNAYVVRDVAAGVAALVDMPLDEEPLLAAIAAEGGVQTVIATHWHPDHWMTYDAVRAARSRSPRSASTAGSTTAPRSRSAAFGSASSTRRATHPAASRCASALP
jgi:glyoxylase-like metal-dependent hydrolase (beta-lactamase superfamily II)